MRTPANFLWRITKVKVAEPVPRFPSVFNGAFIRNRRSLSAQCSPGARSVVASRARRGRAGPGGGGDNVYGGCLAEITRGPGLSGRGLSVSGDGASRRPGAIGG
jgi:hypothetical protein